MSKGNEIQRQQTAIVTHILCLCVTMLVLAGCGTPNIANKEWKYIRVVYLERDENNQLKPQSWDTKDREILNRLRATFPNNGEYKVCHKPFGSRSNRVDIKLRWGSWWSLSDVKGHVDYDIGVEKPTGFMSAFYCKYPKDFYATLINEIKRASGIAVDLHIKYRPGELETLGDNDAYGYERNFPYFP